jgi:hypothetical protein
MDSKPAEGTMPDVPMNWDVRDREEAKKALEDALTDDIRPCFIKA